MSSLSLLIIEDDTELCDLMREFFAQHNVRLEAVHDGRRGLARAMAGGYDLIILDVMIPGIDGFEVLRQLRRQSAAPVIMLTARTEQSDRIAGLDAGADDYVPKPFGPEELLARIRAVLRRAHKKPLSRPERYEVNGVRLHPGSREVWCEGIPVRITSVEYDILEHLVRSAGRVISRDELMMAVHQLQAMPFDRSLDVHISHVRRKLGEHGALIRTVRGVGYMFSAESAVAST